MRKGVLAVLFLLASPEVPAAEAEGSVPFTALFSATCVRHFYALDKLGAALAASRATALAGADAIPFLGGVRGAAWALRVPSGHFVVALRTDRVCSVFAHRAPAAAVERSFEALVSASPGHLVAEKLDSDPGANSGTARTVAWSWSRPDDDLSIVFALTTSQDEAASIQAMASISLARKPGRATRESGAD